MEETKIIDELKTYSDQFREILKDDIVVRMSFYNVKIKQKTNDIFLTCIGGMKILKDNIQYDVGLDISFSRCHIKTFYRNTLEVKYELLKGNYYSLSVNETCSHNVSEYLDTIKPNKRIMTKCLSLINPLLEDDLFPYIDL